MAKNKEEAPVEDDILAQFGPGDDASDPAIDGAVDDLRGVLQNDAEGTLPELGDGGLEMPGGGAEVDLSEFGGDFAGGSDFGGDFGGEIGGGDFGSDDFAGGDFGGDMGGLGDDLGVASGPSQPAGSSLESNYELIMDIPIDVQIVLGSSHMNVATLMNLSEGATIALDRKIGEPVEVVVNGRVIGRGEITVLEDDDTRFGVRMIEVNKTRKKQE